MAIDQFLYRNGKVQLKSLNEWNLKSNLNGERTSLVQKDDVFLTMFCKLSFSLYQDLNWFSKVRINIQSDWIHWNNKTLSQRRHRWEEKDKEEEDWDWSNPYCTGLYPWYDNLTITAELELGTRSSPENLNPQHRLNSYFRILLL